MPPGPNQALGIVPVIVDVARLEVMVSCWSKDSVLHSPAALGSYPTRQAADDANDSGRRHREPSEATSHQSPPCA